MNNFTPRAQQVLAHARREADRFNHHYIGTEHLLLGLLKLGKGVAVTILENLGVELNAVRQQVEQQIGRGTEPQAEGNIPYTPRVRKVLALANREAQELNHTYVGTEHLLLGLIRDGDGVAGQILRHFGVDLEQARRELLDVLTPKYQMDADEDNIIPDDDDEEEENDSPAIPSDEPTAPAYSRQQKSKTPALQAFGRDMTQLARDGKMDPVIGRSSEIERVIQILCRRNKNNPVLLGEAGVGKTAIVEGLAQEIAQGHVPELLRSKRVISLDLALMVAGTKYRGDFEDRVKCIIKEVQRAGDVIVFIDELHTIVGAGSAEGAIDAANILKPALGRGEIQVIGATTPEEYRKHIEKDAALERRFQPVNVPEPDSECCERMLCALRGSLEAHHGLKITDEAITAAVRLSTRYICDRYLPDKAIDLLDEAASRVRVEGSAARSRVEASDVADVVSAWTGVPASSITQSESERLLHLEEALHRRVVGQDEAVSAVARAIRRGRVGLSDPRRPLGSFLFLGPTGVGKTELCRALAEAVYGDEDALIRFDMSEYMEKHAVSKLIGSPPGYVGYGEGGQLTERVRRRPWSVVLFDEIEKAHEDVYNLLLQIMEDGRLTDSEGRRADFRSTIVVMTSNVGAKAITENRPVLGFSASARDGDGAVREAVMSELRQTFRPEFLNRVNDAIVFRRLTPEDVRRIARGMTGAVCERMRALGVQLEVADAALNLLAERGFDPAYGARPLRRCICTDLEDPAADALLNGTVSPGDLLVADARDGKLVLEVR